MPPYDPYSSPLDFTGYGPTSTGGAPLPGEVRQQALNLYHTNRVAEAMPHFDRYVEAAGMGAIRRLQEANASATANQLRDVLYNTQRGQMALDAAMVARRSGFLGSGDPVNYAANITSGIAAGGFSVDIMNGQNQNFGPAQRVSGQGVLSERVAMNFAQGMLQDLYGSGTPDPHKLYGFNMEDASGVFRRLAARGGVGSAGQLVHNASLQQRLDAAKLSATDQGVREGLSRLDLDRLSAIADSPERDQKLEAYLKEFQNPKLANEVKGIVKSSDAFVVNPEARKNASALVRSTLEGMANLKDIYQELQSPELQSMLESISGTRITNQQQSKRAKLMTDNLRQAAEAVGMDPRAFFDLSQNLQLNTRRGLEDATNADSRHDTAVTAAAAAMSNRNQVAAAEAASRTEKEAKLASELGIEGYKPRSFTEISADRDQQNTSMAKMYGGYLASIGGFDKLPEKSKARARELQRQFENAQSPAERDMAERGLRELQGGKEGWAAFVGGRVGKENLIAGAASDQAAETRRRLSNEALNTSALQEQLGSDFGVDAEQARNLASTLTTKLGGGGILEMLKASQGKTAEQRLAGIRQAASNASLTDEELQQVMSTLFDAQGNARSFTKKTAALTAATSYNEESSYGQNADARARLAKLSGTSETRKVLGADRNDITLKGIANAILTKKVSNPDDPEVLGATLDAMKKFGVPLQFDKYDENGELVRDENGNPVKVDVTGKYQNDIDVSQGFTKENLARINQGAGVDVDLAGKLGITQEELIKRTAGGKDAGLMLRANEILRTQKGFRVGGGLSSLTVMSDDVGEAAKDAANRLRKLGIYNQANPDVEEDERTALKDRILRGEDVNVFDSDRYKAYGLKDKDEMNVYNIERDGVRHRTVRLKNADKLISAAQQVNATKDEGAIKEYAKDDVLLQQLKQTRAAMMGAVKNEKADEVYSDTQAPSRGVGIAQSLAQVEEAIKKLEDAASGQTKGDLHVNTLHVINYAPPK